MGADDEVAWSVDGLEASAEHPGGLRSSSELVLVVRPEPEPTDALGQSIATMQGVAERLLAVGEQAAKAATNAVLDRVVPIVVRAVLDRVDLTQLIIERVDVDRIIAEANLDEVIDRLPLVDVANYLIDEIDLPQIVRESTGGIASDAVNLLRMQSIDVDQALSRIVGTVLRRGAWRVSQAEGHDSVPPDGEA